MLKSEQSRLIEDLRQLIYKMSPADKEAFAILQSRHKEDEDFDAISAQRLEKMHKTYKPAAKKEDLEARWKALTSGGSKRS